MCPESDWLILREAGYNTIIGATFTEDRAKDFYFSIPYRDEAIAAFALNSKLSAYDSFEQLLNSKLTGAANTAAFYGEDFDNQKVKFAKKLSHIETSERRFELLNKGRVDYIIGDVGHLTYIINKRNRTNVSMSSFFVTQTQVRFMFAKSSFDEQFINDFNVALKSVLVRQR